jgi:hypothetical protein
MEVDWCRSVDMPDYLISKNLRGSLFKMYTKVFCGEDDYR